MEPNGDKRRGFAVGDPARRSRDGNGKILVRGGEVMAAKRTTAQGGFAQRNAAPDFARQTQKVGPVTGQRGFAAGEMRPNGSKGRGGNGSRVWEKREAPRCRGDDYEICRWRYFLSVKKAGKGRRGFAVGAPARRSRDGNGKTSAPVGPMTGRAVSPEAKRRAI